MIRDVCVLVVLLERCVRSWFCAVSGLLRLMRFMKVNYEATRSAVLCLRRISQAFFSLERKFVSEDSWMSYSETGWAMYAIARCYAWWFGVCICCLRRACVLRDHLTEIGVDSQAYPERLRNQHLWIMYKSVRRVGKLGLSETFNWLIAGEYSAIKRAKKKGSDPILKATRESLDLVLDYTKDEDTMKELRH